MGNLILNTRKELGTSVLTGLLNWILTALLIWYHKKRKEYNKEREI